MCRGAATSSGYRSRRRLAMTRPAADPRSSCRRLRITARSAWLYAVRITSRVKGYPFEVGLLRSLAVAGVVLADQVRSLDWRTRHAEFIGRLPDADVSEVMGLVMALLSEGDA
jgi:mRNA-degrading endonuclease toxin of MazEF toxin-antitoxin module